MNGFDMALASLLYISIAFFAVMCGIQVLNLNRRLNVKHNKRMQRLKNKLKSNYDG